MDKKANKAVREQVASVMRRAAVILGSDKALEKRLQVSEAHISTWMHQQADCPTVHLQGAVYVILEQRAGQSRRNRAEFWRPLRDFGGAFDWCAAKHLKFGRGGEI
ncbi:MAG TPA: hypothetical protein VFB08_20120 [Burkholderiales bacterium]|nr:hypothetical protein [Burkholderiales bacterium]